QAAGVDPGGHGAADVPEMPWLVGVAGDRRLALRVGHHEAVPPGVVAQPGPGPGSTPVGIVPRHPPAVALEVEGRPELVFAVAGPRARLQGGGVAGHADPV